MNPPNFSSFSTCSSPTFLHMKLPFPSSHHWTLHHLFPLLGTFFPILIALNSCSLWLSVTVSRRPLVTVPNPWFYLRCVPLHTALVLQSTVVIADYSCNLLVNGQSILDYELNKDRSSFCFPSRVPGTEYYIFVKLIYK